LAEAIDKRSLEDRSCFHKSEVLRGLNEDGSGGHGEGVAGHGERVAVESESRKIFFAFFAEFFGPFHGVIAESFKAASGGDQLSDPVLRVLLNPLRLSHERKIAADRETARKKNDFLRKKTSRISFFSIDRMQPPPPIMTLPHF